MAADTDPSQRAQTLLSLDRARFTLMHTASMIHKFIIDCLDSSIVVKELAAAAGIAPREGRIARSSAGLARRT